MAQVRLAKTLQIGREVTIPKGAEVRIIEHCGESIIAEYEGRRLLIVSSWLDRG